jgi:3-methylcrotonyl-CoA carboxylase beta subunit
MWPNAKIAVMGSEQLSSVMQTVGKKKFDPTLQRRIEGESEAVFSSARIWDDGVIPPEETRSYLGLGLRVALGGSVKPKDTRFGVFRM